MPRLADIAVLVASVWMGIAPAFADAPAEASGGEEPLVNSVCRLIDSSALAQGLPVSFLTRLIWQESNFQSGVTSPAGAQGIAQFMPGTAGERGLANPFDPEAAIPKAASLLADLKKQFGNLGLAAAAYNAGAGRVARWLSGAGDLPAETQNYVSLITRHVAEDWRDGAATKLTEETVFPDSSCVQNIAASRRAQPEVFARSTLWAPWGVQISGSFNKSAALRAYQRASGAYASVLGGVEPMIIGGRLRSRGFRAFYRVRAPAATRQEAENICAKLQRVGGACVVLRS